MIKNSILLLQRLLPLIILLAHILLHCGCSAANPEKEQNRASVSITDGTLKTYRRDSLYAQSPAPVPTPTPTAASRASIRRNTQKTAERAKKIAVEVIKVNGVFRASVVITDRTALIGIELDGKINGSGLSELRNEIEKTVTELDTDIEHVAVTASPELVKRITGMADSVIADDDTQRYYDNTDEISEFVPTEGI